MKLSTYNKYTVFESLNFEHVSSARIQGLEDIYFKSSTILTLDAIASITINNFVNLRELQRLKLYNNKLTTVPTIFDKLVSLKKIYITNNIIRTLDFDIFSNLPSLKFLNLSNNSLHTFGTLKTFNNTAKLCYLNLSYNQLNEFNPRLTFCQNW